MDRVKVAHIASGVSSTAAGVGIAIEGLTAAQLALGMRIYVVATLGAKEAPPIWNDSEIFFARRLGPKSLGFSVELNRLLNQLDPDIVHIHGLWHLTGFFARNWCKNNDKPFVISTHGMLSKEALAHSRLVKKLFSFFFQKRVIKDASYLIGTSKAETADQLDYEPNTPVTLIPNGVHFEETLEKNETNMKYAAYLGRLHPIKGLENLLIAWNTVVNEHPEWKLFVAGPDSNNYKKYLSKLIYEKNIPNVEFKGPLGYTEKLKMLSGAELSILPSFSENFGLVVAESLASATPVLTTTGTPWIDLADRGCGWLAEPNANSLSECLSSALSLPSTKRESMGIVGRNWIHEEFLWNKVAIQFEILYKNICLTSKNVQLKH